MANNKTGFSYYNVDTDRYQDIRIKRLKKDLGCSGIAVYDYILTEIYRVKGCFIEWDSNTAFDVADYFGIKESLVAEIVNYCCNVGLFDKALLTRENVLSSKSIQTRYLEMCTRAKRKDCQIPEQYDIITEVSAKVPEEYPDYSGSLPQSKVEYSKVKEINNPPISPQGGSADVVDSLKISEDEFTVEATVDKRKKVAPKKEKPGPPAIEEFVAYGLANITGVTSYRSDLWESALRLKYRAWMEAGWKTGGNKPKDIQIWKTTLLHTLPYLERVVSMQIQNQPTTSKLEHNLTVGSRVWGIN